MKPSTAGSAAYNRNKWSILFIGEDGKVVTVKHFKGMVTGLAVLLALLVLGVVVLYYQYHNRAGNVAALQNDIAAVQAEKRKLRDEKDQMMARLVILESRLKEQAMHAPAEDVAGPSGNEAPIQAVAKQPTPAGAAPEKEPKGASKVSKTIAAADDQTQGPPLSIANQNLTVCQDPDSDSMRVEYKVINTGAKDVPQTGRSVIVLKGDSMNSEDWIVLPSVPLLDLKPSGERGKRFRIYNFRTLKYKVASSAVKGNLETATIFTFTVDGKLAMERDYSLDMSAEMCP